MIFLGTNDECVKLEKVFMDNAGNEIYYPAEGNHAGKAFVNGVVYEGRIHRGYVLLIPGDHYIDGV